MDEVIACLKTHLPPPQVSDTINSIGCWINAPQILVESLSCREKCGGPTFYTHFEMPV